MKFNNYICLSSQNETMSEQKTSQQQTLNSGGALCISRLLSALKWARCSPADATVILVAATPGIAAAVLGIAASVGVTISVGVIISVGVTIAVGVTMTVRSVSWSVNVTVAVGSVGGSVSDDSAALVSGAGSVVDWLNDDFASWSVSAARAGRSTSSIAFAGAAGATSVVATVVVADNISVSMAIAVSVSVGWGIVSVSVTVVVAVAVVVDGSGIDNSWSSLSVISFASRAALNLSCDSVGGEGDARCDEC